MTAATLPPPPIRPAQPATSPAPPVAAAAPPMTSVHREPRRHRFTFDQFVTLIDDHGRIDGRPVEFLDGEIFELPPMKNPHRIAVTHTTRLLMGVFPQPFFVCPQCMHKFDEVSAPLPDLLVLPKAPPSQGYANTDTPLLILEISDTSLRHDHRKANLYASQGVPEYWVLDVNSRRLEVYRDPVRDAEAEFGWRYGTSWIVDEAGEVSPLALPEASLAVAQMLP